MRMAQQTRSTKSKIGSNYIKAKGALTLPAPLSSNPGFTLIELVTAIGIFVVLAGVFSSSLIAILKGGSKREVTAEVKQNGDYALSVMTQVLRNPGDLSCDASSVTLITDENKYMFACVNVGGINKLTFGSPDKPPANNPALTSDNVNVECSFTCLEADPPHPGGVMISLTLSQNFATITSGTNITPRAEELAKQTFETTVYQRDYK